MSYARDFILRLEDTDANYKLTNKAILELMENTSDEDSAHYGDDIVSLNAQNLSWVIVEWNLEVYIRPKYHEKVRVVTWPREVNSRFVWREFEVYCGSKKVAAASSKWMIVNLLTKSIVRSNQDRIMKYQIEDRAAITANSKRLKAAEEYSKKRYVALRNCDMDLNGHMHNLNYLDLIKEVVKDEPGKFRIVFHREITPSDKVYVALAKNGVSKQVIIANGDDTPYSIAELGELLDID